MSVGNILYRVVGRAVYAIVLALAHFSQVAQNTPTNTGTKLKELTHTLVQNYSRAL